MSTKKDRELIINFLRNHKNELKKAYETQSGELPNIQSSSLHNIGDNQAMRNQHSETKKKLQEKVRYDFMYNEKHNITISPNVPEDLKKLYIRLLFLSSEGSMNSYYKNLADRLVNINPNQRNQRNQILTEIRNQLQTRIDTKQKYRGNSHKKKFIQDTIKMINNLLPQRGGSKKGPKVKGKRVLKNGTVAGYVRQKDGSYKWRFLKRR